MTTQSISDIANFAKADLYKLTSKNGLAIYLLDTIDDMYIELYRYNQLYGSNTIYLVANNSQQLLLQGNLGIPAKSIITYYPSESILERLDYCLPSNSRIVIWDYFSVPFELLQDILNKDWEYASIFVANLQFSGSSNIWELFDPT